MVAILAGCSFHAGSLTPGDGSGSDIDADAVMPDAPDAPWLPTHSYRKAVRVSPGGAAASLASYPLPVRLAVDADLVAHARADAADLLVTADDGTTIYSHELAYYDASSGAAELWVSIPTLQLDTVTTLYLYYGGPAGTSTPAAVWSSGFKGVWHMSGAAAATMELDSTASANHVTQAVLTSVPSASAGASASGTTIGRSRAFDGTNDSMSVADPVNGSLDVGSTAFAVSLWVNSVQSNGLYDTPLYKGGTNPGNPGYSVFAGTSAWAGKVMDQTSAFMNPQFAAGPINGSWAHLAMSIQRTPTNVATAYLNGVEVGQITFNLQSFDGTAGLTLGGAAAMFQGSIDEVRVYSRTLSADWVATDYASFTTSGFVAVGAEQAK
jgi:hypothetical protein